MPQATVGAGVGWRVCPAGRPGAGVGGRRLCEPLHRGAATGGSYASQNYGPKGGFGGFKFITYFPGNIVSM
jgi:hypothetical protein